MKASAGTSSDTSCDVSLGRRSAGTTFFRCITGQPKLQVTAGHAYLRAIEKDIAPKWAPDILILSLILPCFKRHSANYLANMLGWLSGSGRGEYTGFTEDSKVQDAPETPAPVFAFRAFKSAFVGTPGPDATDDELTVPIKTLKPAIHRKSIDIHVPPKQEKPSPIDMQPSLPQPDELTQPMASPTKSILLTPGTASTRRKTVSFGEGVVDNERKRSPFESTAYNGNISGQWTCKQHVGNGRNRSKLTQSLIEARGQKLSNEKKLNENDELFDIVIRKDPTRVKEVFQSGKTEHDEEDEDEDDSTTNLNEPRSQSGIYWKSEFDSYRARTDREIKKLIEYRSVAKSYAKKKELEMRRLSDKLKREEAKASNEAMFKELSKQTALAVQYKRKTDSLRRALKQHGVLDSDGESPGKNSGSDDVCLKLLETEKALELANAKLKDAKNNKPDTKKLQDLVESSERKASELQKENKALKQSLARFKEEMANYEDRRQAKEERLKQKEQKLQGRVQEYKNRLHEERQQHQEAERLLKQSFTDEKRYMQGIIDSLRQDISTVEQNSHNHTKRKSETRVSPNHIEMRQRDDLQDMHDRKFSPRKGTAMGTRITQGHRDTIESPKKGNTQNERILNCDIPRNNGDGQIDMGELQSRLSGRDGTRAENTRPIRKGSLIDYSEEDEPLNDLEDSLARPRSRDTAPFLDRNSPSVPPSSPPAHQSIENHPEFSISTPRTKLHIQPRITISPRPSMVHMSPKPKALSKQSSQYHHHLRRKASAARVFPRASSKVGVPVSSGPNRRIPPLDKSIPPGSDSANSPAGMKRDALPADRVAAAMRRLKLKEKRWNADGKENVWSG
ncbi:hypothetical protein PAAG_11112 [Paracoccidioides lutzii Pb01]|uniref:Spindle pole body-associated protein cut12 domain-containing protein n=1 Tax=Paracoccidioides lutzii (strain ATCC MYA-826 / Pb01) TaxID=502779 RepID=A0A0A2V795_PARBA|nr:hypothetical protein PAAG_11112 [Paracoccidioides lutzii Pb01]KGQ02157.1 hypothetical protein PAAG_11112 [Paracoccidioides lutzii Pb01]